MKHRTVSYDSEFEVLVGNRGSQAAVMVLEGGASTGGPDNRHKGADQWLYVISGSGEATVAGEKIELSSRTLLLIEAGEAHQIRNTGKEPLRGPSTSTFRPPTQTTGIPCRRGRARGMAHSPE